MIPNTLAAARSSAGKATPGAAAEPVLLSHFDGDPQPWPPLRRSPRAALLQHTRYFSWAFFDLADKQ